MQMDDVRTSVDKLTRKPGDGASDTEEISSRLINNRNREIADDEDDKSKTRRKNLSQDPSKTQNNEQNIKGGKFSDKQRSPVRFEKEIKETDEEIIKTVRRSRSRSENVKDSDGERTDHYVKDYSSKIKDLSDTGEDSESNSKKYRRRSAKRQNRRNETRESFGNRTGSAKERKNDYYADEDDDVDLDKHGPGVIRNSRRRSAKSKGSAVEIKKSSPEMISQKSPSSRRDNYNDTIFPPSLEMNLLLTPEVCRTPSKGFRFDTPSEASSRLSPGADSSPREERKVVKRVSPNQRQNDSPFHGIEDPFRPTSRSNLLSETYSSASVKTPGKSGNASPEPKASKSLLRLRSIGRCLTVPKIVKEKLKTESPEDGYDTDLELDTSEDFNSRQKERRMTISRQDTDIGHHSYEEACAKFSTTPLRRVLNQLWSSKMNLQHLGLNRTEMKALSVALLHNTRIEELDLDDNGLDDKCMSYVTDLLKNNYFITKLNLNNNQIGEAGASLISETLQTTNWLTHVSLSGTQLGDSGMAYIANGLEENMTVKWLDLSHNTFGVNGGLHIGRLLGRNDVIEHLDVSWNQIRLAGAVALCKSLQKNKRLITLNIAWNGLGFEGSLAIGEALKSNKMLATLDLTNNRINWECVPYIGRGLRVNKSLQVLELGLNPISMEGCDELLESVSKTTCGLIHLGLENIPINTEVAYKATEISRQRNFSLHHGGILSTSDVIGIQRAKKEDPFSLLIRYLSTMGIRVVDLFRMFETESKLYVSKANFITGLKRLRVPLDDDGIREVLRKIYINKNGTISYQSLAAAVRKQLRSDRKEDMKEEERERKKREERRRILKSDMPLIAPSERVFFPDIFTFYGSKVIQGTIDLQSPLLYSNSRNSSDNLTPSSAFLPKLSPASPKNVMALHDYDSWRNSPQTLVGSLVYDIQRMTPVKKHQKNSHWSKINKTKLMRKRSD